jgi:hypothetical protein
MVGLIKSRKHSGGWTMSFKKAKPSVQVIHQIVMLVRMINLVSPLLDVLYLSNWVEADDTGKEFCGHLFEQPATAAPQHVKPCINCPGNCMSIKNLLSPVPSNEGFVVDVQPPSPVLSAEEHETMRCDEAWKKLKVCPFSLPPVKRNQGYR